MISREQMFEPLLLALPSFQVRWDEFLGEWSGEAGDPPLYLALSSLARHLVDLLAQGQDAQLRAAFEVVEHWHVAGDAYVKEAATVGLLEDLQNHNLHQVTGPEQFRRFLGPVSEGWWNKVVLFWSEGRLLTDDPDG